MNEMVKRLTAERDELRAEVAMLREERAFRLAAYDHVERELAEARALLACVLPLAEKWADAEHESHPMWDDIRAVRAFLRRDEARRCGCDNWDPLNEKPPHWADCPARDEAQGALEQKCHRLCEFEFTGFHTPACHAMDQPKNPSDGEE